MAAILGREFDPNRKYKVSLSERLLSSSNQSNYTIASIQPDPNLKLPNNVRNASINPGFGANDCELSLASADGKESSYSGKSNSKAKTCALIYDNTTGSFILEQIDTHFIFQASNHAVEVDEFEGTILNALVEESGEAEADNPFDWRHQLQRPRSPTPELEQFRLDTGATPSPAASPITRPFIPRIRQASSPPGMSIEFEDQPSPEPEPSREEFEIGGEEEEDSDDGGLQISWEGAAKPQGFRGRVVERQITGVPISLRSAANSQSPAIRRASSSGSDNDVDDMRLGSPTKQNDTTELDEIELAAALASGLDEVDDMEAEFEKALEDIDEDEVPAAPAYIVDDSSSESEEE